MRFDLYRYLTHMHITFVVRSCQKIKEMYALKVFVCKQQLHKYRFYCYTYIYSSIRFSRYSFTITQLTSPSLASLSSMQNISQFLSIFRISSVVELSDSSPFFETLTNL